MTAPEFQRLVRSLCLLGREDLMWMTPRQYHDFDMDPAGWFGSASDEDARRIWAAIERQGVKA